ncbi:MAG TPA: hypothetical protein VH479_03370 [Acidimicrobiales bacterium]|jgi:hypothetical protein
MPEPSDARPARGPEPGTPQVHEPPAIAPLAAQHGLGAYRNGRTVINPAAIARTGLLALVGAVAIYALGVAVDVGLVVVVGFFAIVFALTLLAYALKTVITGGDNWYLYDGGLVAVNRRQPRVVVWPEVASIRRKRMGRRARRRGMGGVTPDTLRGYRIKLRDGSSVYLTAPDLTDPGRKLGADLERLTATAGIRPEG